LTPGSSEEPRWVGVAWIVVPSAVAALVLFLMAQTG
jgi:hypothetical protein